MSSLAPSRPGETPPKLRWGRHIAVLTLSAAGLLLIGIAHVVDLSDQRSRLEKGSVQLQSLGELRAVAVGLQELRGRHYLQLSAAGGNGAAKDAGERFEETLATLGHRYGDDAEIARELAALREGHRHAHQRLLGRNDVRPEEALRVYSELIDRHNAWLRTNDIELGTADATTLAMASVVLDELPRLSDELGRLRARASAAALRLDGAAIQAIELRTASIERELARIDDHLGGLSSQETSSVNDRLVALKRDFLAYGREASLLDRSPDAQRAEQVFQGGTELVGRVEALNRLLVGILEARLQRRASELAVDRILAIAAIVLALALMLYFVLDFRRTYGLSARAEAEARARLSASDARNATILENMVDGVILIDRRGKILSFNAAAAHLFGYRADEVLGRPVDMLMPEPHRSDHDGYMERYHETGEKRIIGIGREVEGLRKDGTRFPFDLSVAEIGDGEQTIYCGTIHDLTERKRIDTLKNEFVSTVSHELRTPLTSIRGSLGLLVGGAVGELPPQAQEMLRIASNNTQRLLHLINDILDIQKIESGQMSFRFRRLELNPFIEQAVRENAAYAKQHETEIVVVQSLADASVYADRDRLMQVLANLLSNAAKFSKAGEPIEISVARTFGGSVRISVSDHGPGIPDDFQPKVFEKFTQGDASDARHRGGTGLGMSITKAIVERHGGRIDFVSRKGLGTTFFFEIPELSVEQLPEAESPSLPPELGRLRPGARVLIVEDDADVGVIMKRILAEAGFDADIAASAELAWEMLNDFPNLYQVITLDMVLPGQDGISFLETLRADPKHREIPVVVVSVQANESRRSLNGGAVRVVDWLQKPFDESRLIAAINRAAAQGERARVLHVEDEDDVHTVVRALLKEHCDIARAANVAEAKEALAEYRFELVLLDIGLPDGSGFDVLETIEAQTPQPQVVIFSAQDIGDEHARRVNAVLSKSRTSNEGLVQAVRTALCPPDCACFETPVK